MVRYLNRDDGEIVEAARLGGGLKPNWLREAIESGNVHVATWHGPPVAMIAQPLDVQTRAGIARANAGDWIIRRANVDLVVHKHDAFDFFFKSE